MFKVVGDKIYFQDSLVARFDEWLRPSLKWDAVSELEGHTKVEDVSSMLERIGRLEAAVTEVEVREIRGAEWS